MNKEPQDIDQILPFGEMLRSFMEQSFISKNDLKELLRSKGIFISSSEKQDSIPILMRTILSPGEFDQLKESQNSKEDNPKIITQSIEWQSNDTLIESLPDRFDLNSILELDFSNFKVVGSPNFISINDDPNHIKIDFEVERDDLSKSWASTKTVFPGSLELKRVIQNKEVKLVVTHTANETKYVANKTSSNLISHFKKKGFIDEKMELSKILYNSFTNAKRIDYFLDMSKNFKSSLLKFKDLIDIEFSPDKVNTLPDGMQWMEKRIDDLKMNGQSLHKTLFVKEKRYHSFIELYRVDASFTFDYKGITGNCTISLNFPDYGKSKDVNSELEINVKSIVTDTILKDFSRSELKKILLKEFENLKLENYKKHAA